MTENNKKRILVIDDSEDSQFLHSMMLNANGYSVESTPNGKKALSLLSKLTELPDLILLDARMPVMDGYNFRRHQCQDKRICDIPVVVITGDNDVAKVSRKMLSPLKVICKPLHYQSFVKLIFNSLATTV